VEIENPSRVNYWFTRRAGAVASNVGVGILYLFLLAPILIVFVLSFNSGKTLTFPFDGVTFDWYVTLAENSAFLNGATTSLITASIVTVLVLAVGVPASFALNRYEFTGKAVISGLFLAPLLVPSVVLGLALLLVFAPMNLTGTYTGIVIAHVGICLPYVIRTTLMSLETSDTSCEEAARVLGANGWEVFRRVTLPIIAPGVMAGAVMAFIISFDEAVISLFVAGSGKTTLPVEMFRYVEQRTDPQIAALSVCVIVISLSLVVVVERAMGLRNVLR
jgi:putative spermidine/putrescine transport system permease protein